MTEATQNNTTPAGNEKPALVHSPVSHQAAADVIVSKYMGWGAGAGAVPIPLWDLVAIGSVHVLMLKELYTLYGVSFNENKTRTTVGLLLASLSPKVLAGATAATLLKIVPVFGSALATVTLPLLSAASTYAMGRVMISHLEQGGTPDNFDVSKNSSKFSEAVEKGKEVAKDIKHTVTKTKKAPATAPVAAKAPTEAKAQVKAEADTKAKTQAETKAEAQVEVKVEAQAPVSPATTKSAAKEPATKKATARTTTRKKAAAKPAATKRATTSAAKDDAKDADDSAS